MERYRMKKKETMKERKTVGALLPLILVLAVIPLVCIIHKYESGLESQKWFASAGTVYDVFLYYKSKLLIIVGLVLACMTGSYLYSKKETLFRDDRSRYVLICLGCFAAFSLISVLFSYELGQALWGGYEQWEGAAVLLTYALIFLFTYAFLHYEQELHVLFGAFAIGALIVGVLGTFQTAGYDFIKSKGMHAILTALEPETLGVKISLNFKEAYATLYNPNYVGSYVALGLPVMTGLVVWSKKIWLKIVAALAAATMLISLYSSQSFAGFIGLAAAAVLLAVFAAPALIKKPKIGISVVAVVILAAVLVIVIRPAALKGVWDRLTQVTAGQTKHMIEDVVVEKGDLVVTTSSGDEVRTAITYKDGFQYKIQDYLTAFGVISWFPSFFPLLGGIILSAIEFSIGIFLFFGIKKTISTTLALVLMIFMTPLTLYLAIFDPVSDCGCFGDAWVLTNWETFAKNIVLLLAAIATFQWRKMLIRFVTRKMEWLISLYTIFFVFTLSFYCLDRLPVLDFRPYKIGQNIMKGMSIPEGAKPSVYESVFILEKNGEKKEFTLDNYPDSTWTFVDTHTILKEKGYEPSIHDFSMMDMSTGDDITEDVLTDMGYTFLLVAHRIEEADDSNIDLINEIYDYSVEHGYRFYCLTSSPEEQIELWKDKTGAEYPFCQMDDITLKTMIRSNPGLMLIKNGTILNKWSDEDIPDEYVLTDKLENLELGQQKVRSDVHTIGYVFLWFVIPLLLVLGVDILIVRRRERKNEKRKQQQEVKE